MVKPQLECRAWCYRTHEHSAAVLQRLLQLESRAQPPQASAYRLSTEYGPTIAILAEPSVFADQEVLRAVAGGMRITVRPEVADLLLERTRQWAATKAKTHITYAVPEPIYSDDSWPVRPDDVLE